MNASNSFKSEFPSINFNNLNSLTSECLVTDEEPYKQLIILGNGFDLACGLKSSYLAFFEYIFQKKTTNANYWYNIFKSLFNRNNKIKNWTDVESRILIELKNIDFLYSSGIFREGNRILLSSSLRNRIANTLKSIDPECSIEEIQSIYHSAILLIKHTGKRIPPIIYSYNYLKSDLLELEIDFQCFLKEQIKYESSMKEAIFQNNKEHKCSSYFIKSICLISYILMHNPQYTPSFEIFNRIINSIPTMASFEELSVQLNTLNGTANKTTKELVQTSIISFNYTNPFENINIRNIHGSLFSNNIIFGIDYDKLIGYFDQLPIDFSKSYRILESGNKSALTITSNTNIIKFYGHGLGPADYAYFQAIFDTVDLYHGNTHLVFYWSAYDKELTDYIYKDYVMNVVNLIEEYGKTFTNQDHGRNLLTKLQLENRLKIEEIDLDFIFSFTQSDS